METKTIVIGGGAGVATLTALVYVFLLMGGSDDVCTLNNTRALINVYPCHATQSGWIYASISSKQFGGDINFALGTSKRDVRFSNFQLHGNWTDVNGTNVEWKNFNMTIINYTFDGKDLWYVGKDFPIVQGQDYLIRYWVEIEGDGKYDAAFWRSVDTIAQAIANDRFLYVDPYYNATGGVIIFSDYNLTDRMFAYYKLDEMSTTQSKDSLDNLTNVTFALSSGVSFGKINNSRIFNATSYGTSTDTKWNNLGQPSNGAFSVNLWVNRTGCVNAMRIIEKGANQDMRITDVGAACDGRWQWVVGACTNSSAASPNMIPLNNWTMITMTFTGSGGKLGMYFDGVLYSNTTCGATGLGTASTSMNFGRYGADLNYNFRGQIDEVGFWNRSLNAQEVALLYNITRDGSVTGQYPFNVSTTSVISINASLGSGVLFNFTPDVYNFYQKNVSPNGQTDDVGLFYVCNNGTGLSNVFMNMSSVSSFVALKCSNTSQTSNALNINLSNTVLINDLGIGVCSYIWCWADYNGLTIQFQPEVNVEAS